jgi:flagellar protein FlaE/flagellar protein FlaC
MGLELPVLGAPTAAAWAIATLGLVGASVLDRFLDDDGSDNDSSGGIDGDDNPFGGDMSGGMGGGMSDGGGGGFDDFDGMNEWDDDFDDDSAGTDELENRLSELENEVASLSSTVSTVRSENEEISNAVNNIEEDVRNLLDIYEMVTRGINPFVDESGGFDSIAGGDDGSFGIFDDDDNDDEEALDEDVANADADGFFDDDLLDEEEPEGFDQEDFDDSTDDDALDDLDDGFEELDDDSTDDDALDDLDDDFEELDDDSTDDAASDTETADDGEDMNEDGKSFSELKEEYDSGEADWADEDDDAADEDPFDDGADSFDDPGDQTDPFEDGDDEVFDETTEPDEAPQDDLSPSQGGDPTEATDEFEYVGADNLSTSGTHAKPYLTKLPADYVGDLLVMEWLEFLVSESDATDAVRAINYYERIEWIGGDAAARLRDFLSGFGTIDRNLVDRPGTDQLFREHHTRSLRYITQLNGTNSQTILLDRWDDLAGKSLVGSRRSTPRSGANAARSSHDQRSSDHDSPNTSERQEEPDVHKKRANGSDRTEDDTASETDPDQHERNGSPRPMNDPNPRSDHADPADGGWGDGR